ncbi:hypothetical protein [Streptomyces sp. MBT33]|uniref:DUF6895 family protein n=1 Tax=Streptomyces sp. MBT33 TaxID=1488363 RepID=UPI0027DCF541|nr:hypothetical protein [Streptomyces sp. MBT33]
MTAAPTRQVQEAALAWVVAQRGRFALGDDALAPDGRVNSTWKPLGELAQVCATLVRHTSHADPLHAHVRDLLDFAWRETGEGELLLRLQRAEPFATYPLEVYAAFASAGLRHPGYEEAAARVARTRGWRLTEQDPTRSLGVLLAERTSGLRPHADPDRVLARTWLGGLPEPWTFERPSGYAVTHVVFHLTEWGRGGPGVPPALADYLTDWLPAWLETCLEAHMWDLACELLATAVLLPAPPNTETLAGAWSRIADAQQASGALPEEGGFEALPDGPGFAYSYHSTLMAAFAAGLTAGRTSRPDSGARLAPGGQGVPG